MIFSLKESTIIAEDPSAEISEPSKFVETLIDIVHDSLINHVVRLNSFQAIVIINYVILNSLPNDYLL